MNFQFQLNDYRRFEISEFSPISISTTSFSKDLLYSRTLFFFAGNPTGTTKQLTKETVLDFRYRSCCLKSSYQHSTATIYSLDPKSLHLIN